MGWLRLVGSLRLQVSFAEYHFFFRSLLQKRPFILRSLLIAATPQQLNLHTVYIHIIQPFKGSDSIYRSYTAIFMKWQTADFRKILPVAASGLVSAYAAKPYYHGFGTNVQKYGQHFQRFSNVGVVCS